MKLLFDDSLAPITSTIGFIKATTSEAARAFVEWQRPIQSARSVEILARPAHGKMEHLLLELLPLTSVENRRFLFIPTIGGKWTAFFDNGHKGTDAASAMSVMSRHLKTDTVRVVAVENTIKSDVGNAGGRYGAIMFELFGVTPRSIAVANDGGRWKFVQVGTPLPAENVSAYSYKKIQERFTFDALASLLLSLGLEPFSPDFYRATESSPAILVEKTGPHAPAMKEFSLSDVRSRF